MGLGLLGDLISWFGEGEGEGDIVAVINWAASPGVIDTLVHPKLCTGFAKPQG